jgi:hypothetical protein
MNIRSQSFFMSSMEFEIGDRVEAELFPLKKELYWHDKTYKEYGASSLKRFNRLNIYYVKGEVVMKIFSVKEAKRLLKLSEL